MSHTAWGNFWKDQKESFYPVMKVSTTFFAEQIEKQALIKAGDHVLDYGCGPGFLSDYFAKQNVAITSADINPSFIAQSKKAHPAATFILITTDAEANKLILEQQLAGERFDVITLLSIIQYFKDEEEVEKTVGLLAPYLSGSGKIIVADVIDASTSSARDALAAFFLCIKKGRAIAFARFILYLLSSSYRDISQKNKLLPMPEQSMRKIAAAHHLRWQKVKGLTPHPTRASYILEKQA